MSVFLSRDKAASEAASNAYREAEDAGPIMDLEGKSRAKAALVSWLRWVLANYPNQLRKAASDQLAIQAAADLIEEALWEFVNRPDADEAKREVLEEFAEQEEVE